MVIIIVDLIFFFIYSKMLREEATWSGSEAAALPILATRCRPNKVYKMNKLSSQLYLLCSAGK